MGCFPLFIRVWIRSRTFQDISKRAVVTTEQKTCSKCFPCIFSSDPHNEPVTWVHGNFAKATPPKRQSWIPASLITPPPPVYPLLHCIWGRSVCPKSGREPSSGSTHHTAAVSAAAAVTVGTAGPAPASPGLSVCHCHCHTGLLEGDVGKQRLPLETYLRGPHNATSKAVEGRLILLNSLSN